MRFFAANFDNIAVSAAQDLFEIATPATSGARLCGWVFGQTTRQGDAEAEMLRYQIIRGHSTTGSGGSTITAATSLTPNAGTWGSTVKRNNTTAATGGSPQTLHADTWNVQVGEKIFLPPELWHEVLPSSRIVLNIPETPGASMNISATIYWAEL